jgi:uncharacterized delta-60 repeat protein
MMSVIAVCLTFGTAASALAGAGDLDTSYGQGGAAIADFGTFQNGAVVDQAFGNAIVVQPDGKVIVVGTGVDQFGQTNDIVTARFTTAGALDPSWGGTGRAQFDFGQNETGYGAVLQPDGKLIVAGDTAAGSTSDVLVARIGTDGTLDPTFGTGGRAHPDFGDQQFGRAVALQPDGRIVVVGYDAGGDAVVVRLSNGGVPDLSFHGTGLGRYYYDGKTASIDALAVAPDGSIDLAGRVSASATQGDMAFIRVAADGYTVDPLNEDIGLDDSASAIAFGPGGTRLLAGYTNVNGTYDFAVERMAAGDDPPVDQSFGTAGRAVIDVGGTDYAHGMVVQPDGKIVVAGTTTAGSGSTATSKIGVVRLLPGGQPDPTFGTNGVSIVSIPGAKLTGNAVALQTNGDIVVGGTIIPAGSTRRQQLVVRLHGDATGDASTGGGSTTSGGGSTTTTTGGGSTGGGGASTSKTIPVLGSLAVAPFAFAAAPGGATVIISPASRKGALISYQLNVAATVSFVIERNLPGRRQRVNGRQRCVAQTHANEHAQACLRVVSVGSFTLAGKAGANSFRFSGRIDGKKLPRASYTLVATAKTLVAGRAVSKTFKIKG